jgi:hypothetical protein
VELFEQALWGPHGGAQRAFLAARGLREPILREYRIGAFLGRDHAWDDGARTALVRARVLRRDVGPAVVAPWPDAAGSTGGLIYRMLAPLEMDTAKGPVSLKFCLLGDRTGLPCLGEAALLAAGCHEAVLVEGTFDFLALRQAGETRVVTANSCNVRLAQLARLKAGGVSKLLIAMDADEAGARGAEGAVELCAALGIDPWLVPADSAGRDADEALCAEGIEAWRRRCAWAQDGLSAYARELTARHAAAGFSRDACLAAAALFCAQRRPDLDMADFEQRFWPWVLAATGATAAARDSALAKARYDVSQKRSFSRIMPKAA